VTGSGARGGQQRIPRPSVASRLESPWAVLTPDARVLRVADVRERLRDLPPPRTAELPPYFVAGSTEPVNSADPVAARDAAVLLPLFDEAGEARLVLTRRPQHLPTHQGEIALPGGKVDVALDADAAAAALREAREEIALAPESVTIIAELDHVPSVGGPFVIAPFVGIVDARPHLVAAPGEVDRVFDVALSELLDPAVHHVEQWGERRMHFFVLEDETVWGATARILAGFLGLLTGVAAG